MTAPAYLTAADLEAFFGADEISQLADTGAGVALVVETANSEVDSYVAQATGGAAIEPPLALKQAAADLARFRLYKDAAPEVVVKRYEAALKYLARIADGKVSLPRPLDNPATPQNEAEAFGAWADAPERLLARDKLGGW